MDRYKSVRQHCRAEIERSGYRLTADQIEMTACQWLAERGELNVTDAVIDDLVGACLWWQRRQAVADDAAPG